MDVLTQWRSNRDGETYVSCVVPVARINSRSLAMDTTTQTTLTTVSLFPSTTQAIAEVSTLKLHNV